MVIRNYLTVSILVELPSVRSELSNWLVVVLPAWSLSTNIKVEVSVLTYAIIGEKVFYLRNGYILYVW